MSAYMLRRFGAVVAVGALAVLGLASASNAGTTARGSGPLTARIAGSSRGWHQLLKIPNANLYTMAAVSHNAWAAGYVITSGHSYPLLEHSSGGAWHRVGLPARVSLRDGAVEYVAASSPNNVWLLITYAGKNVVASWNGHRWQVRNQGGGDLGLAAVTFSASDTWDFGTYGVGHITGSGWRTYGLDIKVTGVSSVSSRDIWAFGFFAHGPLPAGVRWNGRHWTDERVPRSVLPKGITSLVPGGIQAFGPSDVWAVCTGLSSKKGALGAPIVLHWNGHGWRRAYSGPVGEFGSLTMVSAASGRDLWMTSPFINAKVLHEHQGKFSWINGPKLNKDAFEVSALAWIPGSRNLLFTGFLVSEVQRQYGHVESYGY